MKPFSTRKSFWISRLICVTCILLGIGLDLYTKSLAVQNLRGSDDVILIPSVLRFRYVENRGAAFGSLSDSRWVFLIISSVAIVGILLYLFLKKDVKTYELVTLSAILSGGIGNMIERVGKGYVVDFIDFYLIDFAVFNVADCFVTVGCFALLFFLILEFIAESKEKAS